jgi:hypothetical protein
MEAVCTSEMLIYFSETTRLYIPDGKNLQDFVVFIVAFFH